MPLLTNGNNGSGAAEPRGQGSDDLAASARPVAPANKPELLERSTRIGTLLEQAKSVGRQIEAAKRKTIAHRQTAGNLRISATGDPIRTTATFSQNASGDTRQPSQHQLECNADTGQTTATTTGLDNRRGSHQPHAHSMATDRRKNGRSGNKAGPNRNICAICDTMHRANPARSEQRVP